MGLPYTGDSCRLCFPVLAGQWRVGLARLSIRFARGRAPGTGRSVYRGHILTSACLSCMPDTQRAFGTGLTGVTQPEPGTPGTWPVRAKTNDTLIANHDGWPDGDSRGYGPQRASVLIARAFSAPNMIHYRLTRYWRQTAHAPSEVPPYP